MKKIIHLSDIHIGHKDCFAKAKQIVQNIIERMQPAADYMIVFTGDFANNAYHQQQYDLALQLVNRLKEAGYTMLMFLLSQLNILSVRRLLLKCLMTKVFISRIVAHATCEVGLISRGLEVI